MWRCAVVEGSNHGGVGALHHAHDAAFGAALAGVGGKLDQHLIAVHRLAGIERRDEHIALQSLACLPVQRPHEAEAVAVHGQGSGDQIAIHRRRGDGVTVARHQHQFAPHHQIGQQGFQFLALASAQRELADELLVAGGTLGLVVDVLEQIAFRDHSPML